MIVAGLMVLAVLATACTPTGAEVESGAMEGVDKTPVAAEDKSEVMPVPTEVAELVGTRWVVETYLNAGGELVQPLADKELTATFDLDRVSGESGCNNYFASYAVDGNALTISQAGSTLMACEPAELMQQEVDFLAALQSAATYTIDGDQLLIANAAGETVLTFRASQPTGLVGTAWTATMYNTGTEAVTNLMEGTTITANFTEDGKLDGSAGCNTYMTSYTLDGQNITIEPPATTRKLCPEPAGVMEQETAFVTMLPQAATYTISGNTLELRTADGALITSFTAAQ